jgi:hypothetical protein
MTFEKRSGSARVRMNRHARGFLGDAFPHGALVGAGAAGAPHRETDRLGVAAAQLGEGNALGAGEAALAVAPAPAALLDAGDRDVERGPAGHQQAEVEDAILLRARQLLAVEQEQLPGAAVQQSEMGHGARF